MRRLTLAPILAAVLLVCAGVGRTLACAGDKMLLDEEFTFADASWGDEGSNFLIKDGGALLKAEINHGYKALDNSFLFDDVDICLTATALEIAKPDVSAGGLAFWAQDYRNAYFLLISTNGYFKIGRLVNGAWVTPPFDWVQSPAVVQGINKPNKLGLTIKGQTLSVTINGTTTTKLHAQSPGAPSLVGIYAESGDKVDTWKFNSLKITNVK